MYSVILLTFFVRWTRGSGGICDKVTHKEKGRGEGGGREKEKKQEGERETRKIQPKCDCHILILPWSTHNQNELESLSIRGDHLPLPHYFHYPQCDCFGLAQTLYFGVFTSKIIPITYPLHPLQTIVSQCIADPPPGLISSSPFFAAHLLLCLLRFIIVHYWEMTKASGSVTNHFDDVVPSCLFF